MSKKKAKSKKKTVKKVVKKASKKAPKRGVKKARVAKAAAKRGGAARVSWLDDKGQKPIIDRYARQLKSFLDALADGKVDASEVAAQESRLVELMKEIEPKLSDSMHGKVTQLLCELTAYDLMQVLHSMHEAKPTTVFRG
ncbi:MAG: hypothetical protein JXQ73_16735 [Phycisphaerae bacterium]|nr:hypothetical protein [Phycisphaerae bacterium]